MKTIKTVLLLACLGALSALNAETYSENTTVSGEEVWTIPSGQTLEFDVAASVTVTVTRCISGEGALVKKGMGCLVLAAENSYAGGTQIQQGELFLNREGCLGTGEVRFTADKSFSLCFNAPDATFANDIVFDYAGSFISTYRTQIIFDENTHLTGKITGPSSGTVYIGIIQITDSNPTAHQHVELDGDLDFSKCKLGIRTYGVFTFNGRVDAKEMIMSNTFSGCGHLHFNHPGNNLGSGNEVSCYCPYIICGAENAVSNFSWVTQYNYGSTSGNCMDLNGYNQTLKRVRSNPVGDPGYKPPSAPNDGNASQFAFTSAEPATLTFTGLDLGRSFTNYTFHAISGALSLTLDAPSSYTLVLSNRTHRMNGEVVVSNGTLCAMGLASFPNAQAVKVAAGAAFDFVDANQNALAGCGELKVDGRFTLDSAQAQVMAFPDVALGADAEIRLPAAVKLQVRSLTVAGVPLPFDTYVAGDARVPQLKSGSLKVMEQLWPDLVEPVYTFSVEEGITNRMDDMDVEVLEGGVTTTKAFSAIPDPTLGTVRKIGRGVAISSQKFTAFTGQFLVEEGGLATDDLHQLGPLNASTAPVIWVHKHASFILLNTANTCGRSEFKMNNAFHLAGEGLNGFGAIDNEFDAYQNYAFNGSNPWYLDDDTRISGLSSQRFDLGKTTIIMQRHKLYLQQAPGSTVRPNFVWTEVTLQSMGDIVCNGYSFTPQGGEYWPSGAAATLVVTNGSNISYYNSSHSGGDAFTLQFCGGAANTWNVSGSTNANSTMYPGAVKQGWWNGPVQVDGNVHIYGSQVQKGCALRGKVSGAGDILLSSGWMHFYSPENDFTGRLTMRITATRDYAGFEQGIAAYANGALPLTCPSVSITNGACALLDDARFDLPPVEFYATAGTNLNFYCANDKVKAGTLAGLRKAGPGDMTYAVPLAVTGVVEAAEGTIDVTAGALAAGSLALGGGRIVGDVTVSDALVYAPAAFQNGTFTKLTIDGKLTFAEGATVDLDAFVATGERAAGAADGLAVVEATGGIVGCPRIVRGTATQRDFWQCSAVGDKLYLARVRGTLFIFR